MLDAISKYPDAYDGPQKLDQVRKFIIWLHGNFHLSISGSNKI